MDKLHQPTVAGTGRRRGERDGGQQSCLLCWPYECSQVSLSSGAAHSYFGAALSSKNKEKKKILRIYGFEGEAGREGEGRTRISESSRRRGDIMRVPAGFPEAGGAKSERSLVRARIAECIEELSSHSTAGAGTFAADSGYPTSTTW